MAKSKKIRKSTDPTALTGTSPNLGEEIKIIKRIGYLK